MRNFLTFFAGFLLFSFFQVFASASVPNVFTDVSSSNSFYDAVKYVKEQGIAQGYSDGSFHTEKNVNRAEFLKLILEAQSGFSIQDAKKCMDRTTLKTHFSDVPSNVWYAPYVCYAFEKGIIKGYSDGSFKASKNINLPEMAKITTLTQNIPAKEWTTGEWYVPYIQALSEKKAIPDSVDTVLHSINRGEMVEVLYRLKSGIDDKAAFIYNPASSSLTPFIAANGLGKIRSCAELQGILEKSSSSGNRGTVYMKDMAAPVAAPATTEAPTSGIATSESSTSTEFSQTNVQVQGVDEADIIKNDGKYIYLIKGNTVRIVNAYPADSMKDLASFQVDDTNFQPQEMFLNENQLIIIGSSWKNSGAMPLSQSIDAMEKRLPGFLPPMWRSYNSTKVYIVNVSNHEKPRIERQMRFDANYSKSRRINNIAYLVLNTYPQYIPFATEKAGADLMIPQVEDSLSGKSVPAASCGSVSYFPGYEQANYLIVAAIPLDDTNKEVTKNVFLGSSENIYMSLNALYIATGAPGTGDVWNWDSTQVYKFDLDGLKITAAGTGKVPGRILNQFSMDEYNNTFRIATTKDEYVNNENKTTNRLYILDKTMNQIGAIESIAPGESIYSVRFMGDRAYMVTFQHVDPLFVIDLSDTKAPKVLGELKIPGWSDYLHPYDATHLIGFGKEVDASIDADKVHSSDAIYYTAVQGMKVSLFDVSDVKNPKEMSKLVIGDRGTDSDLLRDHRALFFDKEKNLLAFPITVQKKVSTTGLQCGRYRFDSCPVSCEKRCIPTSCSETNGVVTCTNDCGGMGSCMNPSYEQFQTTFSGAEVLSISLKDGIKEKGRISNFNTKDYEGTYFSGDYQKVIQRIVSIGKYLYGVSQSMITAADIDTVKEVNKLELGDKLINQCPASVNCMPGPDSKKQCIVPDGCEGITERVY